MLGTSSLDLLLVWRKWSQVGWNRSTKYYKYAHLYPSQSRQQHLLLRHIKEKDVSWVKFFLSHMSLFYLPKCAELTYRLPISVCNTFKGITSHKYKVCLSKSDRNLYLALILKTWGYSWDQEIIHRWTGQSSLRQCRLQNFIFSDTFCSDTSLDPDT